MKDILTLTMNPTIDRSCTIEHVVPERKLRCSRPDQEPGGGGLNVTRAIKNLGGRSEALYVRGGPTGIMLGDLLEKEGIRHRPVETRGWTRENLIVLESSTGQQYRFGLPGPELKESEWRQVLDMVKGLSPDMAFLVASGSLPPGVPVDFHARVARITRDMDVRLIIDTSGEPLSAALEEGGIFLVKPNIGELREIARAQFGSEEEIIGYAEKLIQKEKVKVVVISLGSAGSLLVTRKGCRKLRAPTVSIRSKVGAGDSMVAGIALSLARGNPIEDAALFGIAAGAAAVMTPGTELCRREDTERLYEQLGMAS